MLSHLKSPVFASSPTPQLACTVPQRRCVSRHPAHVSGHSKDSKRGSTTTPAALASRRKQLIASGALIALQGVQALPVLADDSASIEITSDEPGVGTHPAGGKDLLLVHYVGRIKDTGQVFDSTLGGLTYRDGGPGVLRPVAIQLGGGPVPGITKGLRKGLEGMTVGGKRSFVVPPELGFTKDVLAPYAFVPAMSTLTYDVQLLRLSTKGPDELTKGIDRCGQGGAAQQTQKCDDISIAEFV